MQRTYIKDLREKAGSEATVEGYINGRRDHGKLCFLDIRDLSGSVQTIVLPQNADAHVASKDLRPEWTVSITGQVNKRPERMVNKNEQMGDIEFEAKSITVLSRAQELPFAVDAELNIDTKLDNLPFALRSKRSRAIFKVQSVVTKTFRDFLTSQGFTEFQAPKLIGDDAEGGANSFDVKYFKHTAHLAQSPQLYKQIMVGVLERVFAIGNVYRAEKHSTTRHLNEYTSMDFEMGFIKDHRDIMRVENDYFIALEKALRETCVAEFATLGAEIPTVPQDIPTMTLREAQALISKETGVDCTHELDLEPEHERWLCKWSKEKHNSDFVFVTHYPTAKRPFYTHRDETDPTMTKSFDLLFRGVEITSGGQRNHDYDVLVSSMKDKGLNPDKFGYYLQAFKYGMPPHGGLGIGLERVTAKLLNIENVKEATLFPRDINRIDVLLSK